MPAPVIYQCLRPNCRFRFPGSMGVPGAAHCPKCGAPLQVIESHYPALGARPGNKYSAGPEVEVLLDNIRSTFNVGAIFRTADGAGVRRLHLCGITPTPDHPKVAKTALGAEFAVPWTQHWDAVAAAASLKESGLRLWALEGGIHSQSLFEAAPDIGSTPILLVIGNEVSGVDPAVLALCQRTVFIPMEGVKRSLNVAIAFSIAVYFLRFSAVIAQNPAAAPLE